MIEHEKSNNSHASAHFSRANVQISFNMMQSKSNKRIIMKPTCNYNPNTTIYLFLTFST